MEEIIMTFKDYLEEQRDYTGSSRSYIRKNDYINRKKKETSEDESTDDTENNKNAQPKKQVSATISKPASKQSDTEEQERTEPEFGSTKRTK